MADIWDAKYNLLTVKPEIDDRIWIGDKDANEQKVMEYDTLKTFFVLRDEDHDINANHEYQAGKKLKFGSLGEFELSHNATDMFFEDVAPAGKIKFRYNAATLSSPSMANFLTLDPVADSIATHGNVINNDGAAGKGLKFAITTNNARFTEQLNCESLLVAENGIKVLLKNISYSGAVDTGLEFDASNHARFKQNLNVEGNTNVVILNASGQINANKLGDYSIDADGNCIFRDNVRFLSYLSRSGADAGIRINTDDSISITTFTQILKTPTSLTTNGDILNFGDYTLGGTANYIAAGGNPGGTATFNPSTATSVQFKNGLYITHS